MKKNYKKLIILLLALFIFIPYVSVKATSYDDSLDKVVGLKVKEDGTISWTPSRYAYGVWVQSDLNDDYNTALINAVNGTTTTINLIDLINQFCPNSSFGCENTIEGTYKVLIRENSPLAESTKVNSEFTITYSDGKLSGSIVEQEPTIYNVIFNTNGGTIKNGNISQYTKGVGAVLPTEVELDGYTFSGWYDNENFTGDMVTEISTTDTGDKKYYAKWEEIVTLKNIEYTIEAQNPSVKDTIRFTYLDGEVFDFSIVNYFGITDEDIKKTIELLNDPEYTFDLFKQQINKIVEYGKKAVGNNEKLLKLYDIYLYNNGIEIHEVDGGFKLRLKITDDMIGYDSYKLVYIAEDGTIGDSVKLTKNGDYLEGTIAHLSLYALVGSKSENVVEETTDETINNPQTGDNIMLNASIFGLSLIGLISATLYIRKKFN